MLYIKVIMLTHVGPDISSTTQKYSENQLINSGSSTIS